MTRSKVACYAVAAIAVFGPVGWRLMSLESTQARIVRMASLRLEPEPGTVVVGEALFKHEWEPGDKLSPGGDGLGPVYNAHSCVACHHQGGVGGSGGLEHNVT